MCFFSLYASQWSLGTGIFDNYCSTADQKTQPSPAAVESSVRGGQVRGRKWEAPTGAGTPLVSRAYLTGEATSALVLSLPDSSSDFPAPLCTSWLPGESELLSGCALSEWVGMAKLCFSRNPSSPFPIASSYRPPAPSEVLASIVPCSKSCIFLADGSPSASLLLFSAAFQAYIRFFTLSSQKQWF